MSFIFKVLHFETKKLTKLSIRVGKISLKNRSSNFQKIDLNRAKVQMTIVENTK